MSDLENKQGGDNPTVDAKAKGDGVKTAVKKRPRAEESRLYEFWLSPGLEFMRDRIFGIWMTCWFHLILVAGAFVAFIWIYFLLHLKPNDWIDPIEKEKLTTPNGCSEEGLRDRGSSWSLYPDYIRDFRSLSAKAMKGYQIAVNKEDGQLALLFRGRPVVLNPLDPKNEISRRGPFGIGNTIAFQGSLAQFQAETEEFNHLLNSEIGRVWDSLGTGRGRTKKLSLVFFLTGEGERYLVLNNKAVAEFRGTPSLNWLPKLERLFLRASVLDRSGIGKPVGPPDDRPGEDAARAEREEARLGLILERIYDEFEQPKLSRSSEAPVESEYIKGKDDSTEVAVGPVESIPKKTWVDRADRILRLHFAELASEIDFSEEMLQSFLEEIYNRELRASKKDLVGHYLDHLDLFYPSKRNKRLREALRSFLETFLKEWKLERHLEFEEKTSHPTKFEKKHLRGHAKTFPLPTKHQWVERHLKIEKETSHLTKFGKEHFRGHAKEILDKIYDDILIKEGRTEWINRQVSKLKEMISSTAEQDTWISRYQRKVIAASEHFAHLWSIGDSAELTDDEQKQIRKKLNHWAATAAKAFCPQAREGKPSQLPSPCIDSQQYLYKGRKDKGGEDNRREDNYEVVLSSAISCANQRLHGELQHISEKEVGFFWIIGAYRWLELALWTCFGVFTHNLYWIGMYCAGKREDVENPWNPNNTPRDFARLLYAPLLTIALFMIAEYAGFTREASELNRSTLVPLGIAFILGLFPNTAYRIISRIPTTLFQKEVTSAEEKEKKRDLEPRKASTRKLTLGAVTVDDLNKNIKELLTTMLR